MFRADSTSVTTTPTEPAKGPVVPVLPNAPVETKVVAGSGTVVVTGLVTWILVTYVWPHGIPSDLQPFVPVAVSWLLGTLAAYLAPHTHRPDLPPISGS